MAKIRYRGSVQGRSLFGKKKIKIINHPTLPLFSYKKVVYNADLLEGRDKVFLDKDNLIGAIHTGTLLPNGSCSQVNKIRNAAVVITNASECKDDKELEIKTTK